MRRPTNLLLTALTLVGVTAVVQTSEASSPTFKKTFSVSLSGVDGPPYTLDASSTYAVTVNIANTTNGPLAFGSAEVTLPTGITVTSGTKPTATATGATAAFTATRLSNTVVLVTSSGPSGSGVLKPGVLSIGLSISTGTSACPPTWGIQVKQSNDFSGTGNDFVPTNTISTPIGQGTLSWTTQPSTTQWNVAMGSIAGSAPVVTATGACGATVAAPPISISDDFTPSNVATTGASASGSAVTLTNLTFNAYDFTDHLTASAPGFTSATSDPFDVQEKLGVCTAASCPPLHVTGTQTSVDLSLTYDGSSRIDTASHHGADVLCNGQASFYPNSVSETFKVNSNSSKGKTLRLTLSKALVNAISNNGAPFMSVCYVPVVNNVD